jgi:17beta-estradiol 17-dehydrogenase / very-long-chain 3-oxoacyl-CoA reductase
MASPTTFVLSGFGVIFLLTFAFSVARWVNIYFFHQSTLQRYSKTSSDKLRPWAFVSGSSDGIGLATARTLLSRGFDVLIHGRNETKLKGISEKLQEEFSGRKIAYVVADAADVDNGVAAIHQSVQKLILNNGGELKILVNNIGK